MATKKVEYIDFYKALEALNDGKKVTRKGWKNVKCIYLVEESKVPFSKMKETVREALELSKCPTEGTVTIAPHIDMIAVNGTVVCGWTPSTADLMAEDWKVLG